MNYRVQPVDLQRFSAGVERLPKSGSVVRCPLARSTARRSGTTANGPAANSTEDPDRQVTAADPERKFTHDEWMTAMQRLQPFAVVVSCPGFCPAAVVRVPERYKEVADLSERANHARPIHTNKRRVMAATVRSSYAPPVATCMPKAIKTSPVVAAIVKESGADQESPRHNPIAATTYAKPARKLNQSTKFT